MRHRRSSQGCGGSAKRRLWNLSALPSLVVFIAVAALWLRSTYLHEGVTWVGARNSVWVSSVSAAVLVGVIGNEPETRPADQGWVRYSRPAADRTHWTDYFGWPAYSVYGHRSRNWTVVVPLWMPAALAAVLPAVWLARRVAARSRPSGLCASCGYDLRETPERCPECGTIPAARPQAAA